jgi:diguanylate cyclase (GGDEF)-like protein
MRRFVELDRNLPLAFEHAPSAMLLSTLDGAVLRANAAARDLLGRDEDELRELGWTGIAGAPLDNGSSLTLTRADGAHLDADISSSVFEGEDGVALCVTALRLRAAGAYHDALTGLPNSTLFLEHLEIAVARAAREQSSLAVLSIQLEGFDRLTELHGDDVGEDVLRQVAYRLRASARLNDVPARRGAHDFLVLVADLGRKVCVPATEGIALRIEDALSTPFKVGDELVECDATVGWAIYPKQVRKARELVTAADAALAARKHERPAAA